MLMTKDVMDAVPASRWAREQFEKAAAAKGLSLHRFMTYLAETTMTPEQWAARSAEGRRLLKEWNGYDPTPEEEAEMDAEMSRQFAEIGLRWAPSRAFCPAPTSEG